MKLTAFAIPTISACAGVVVGMWLVSGREPTINVPCADDPMACAERAAASKCGGPGSYRLLGKSGAAKKRQFDFVCVGTKAV